MIIKSSQRTNAKQLAYHLIDDENERVVLVGAYGVYSIDIAGSLAEFEATAKASRATKPLYHVSISPHEAETMTEEDWNKTWRVHDETHGLRGLQYIEVEHEKNGRTHRHRVYNRINPITGKQ